MSTWRTVIRGGTVVSMDTQIGTLPSGDVLIEDGRITAVAAELPVDDAEVIDATDCIVLPGFIDTHRHTWQGVLRGSLPSCTLSEYFGQVMMGAAAAASAEDVYAGTLISSYEMLNAGITAVVDWANVENTPEHADAGLAALEEAGIRAHYAYGWPGGAEHLVQSSTFHPSDARRVAEEYFSTRDQLLSFGLALRGPFSNPTDVVVSDWRLARELDARINVHVGMRVPGVDIREIAILDSLDLLGADSTFVHCNTSTDEELRRVAETGGHVSVAAYSEMIMGHGRPPINRLLAAGIRPSLSADVVCTVPGDMFSQMRVAYASARSSAFSEDPGAEFAPSVTAEDVLAFATRDGATALGASDRVGVLAPGKDADVILIRTDSINAFPCTDPIGTVVTQVDTSNVDTVLVRGRVAKRDGRLLDVDLPRLRSLARQASPGLRPSTVQGTAS